MKHSLQSLVLVVLTMFFASCAQDIVDVTGTISGIVKDKTSGQFIENCQVTLSPTGSTVFTNSDGRFTFSSLQPGTYTLTFSKSGYSDQSTTVEVISGKTSTLDIQMDQKGGISGTVKDRSTGKSLENCNVYLSPLGISKTTNSSGRFEYDMLNAGTYTLTFSKSGYNDQTTTIKVKSGQISTCDVQLKPSSADMGSISGIVKDYITGQFVENCKVSLSPSGVTKGTDADGLYSFNNLQPGAYTLTFSKIGYHDQSKSVNVEEGKTTTCDVQLRNTDQLELSTQLLDFGESNSTMSFSVKNNTASKYDINIVTSVEWLSFNPSNFTVSANNQMNITAYVDRSKVGPGTYNTTVTLQYTGSTSGNLVLQVRMVYAQQSVPTVETRAAFDVTATTFKIGGVISATGGSVVTAYGHCWSTNPNPTIETAQSTNYGRTTETMSFNSSINQNLVNTVVYVRAYATNAYGTGYGNEVQVTSSSVDPGDGGEFAGGTGTAISPYQLRTPTHMQNMKNYPSAYFKMVADIDMDGINWIPFELKGSFDGDGHTLYNLKISPYVTSDYQGLFSKVSGSASVWNLTIVGVEINAPSYSYVGAIAGYSGCTIGNCHVILNQSNAITGNQKVGGIVGGAQCDIKNCSVSSSLTAPVIVGNGKVGGAIGENIYHDISKVTVNCNISCGAYNGSYTYAIVGGIVGYLGGGTGSKGSISKCTYNGEITGLVPNSVYFGGIVGELSGSDISECKTNVIITASNGAGIGGIVGNASYGNICACYSQGEVHGSVNEGRSNWYGVAGITGYGGTVQHCYTLMDLGVVHAGSTPSGSFAIKDLVNQFSSPINIAEIMRASNSQYASYWNYDRTWTWTGIVNGQSVTAICPKLAWE